jgi:hypothetical protein
MLKLRLASLLAALACLSWVPPVVYIEVAAYPAVGNCELSGTPPTGPNGANFQTRVQNPHSVTAWAYCSVPTGAATVEVQDLDYVAVTVTDLTTTDTVDAQLCFEELVASMASCGTLVSTNINGRMVLNALAPSGWSGTTTQAYLKIKLPAAGANFNTVQGFRLFTH